MTRFNTNQTPAPKVMNKAGGRAFNAQNELKLYLMASATFFSRNAHTTLEERTKEISELVQKVGRKFTLQLANYLRNEYGLRTVSTFLLAEAAKLPNEEKDSLVREYTPKILKRADEPAELLSALWKGGQKTKTPKAILRGIGDAFSQWDAYQLRKYYGRGKKVSLQNVIKLVRPKPKNSEQEKLFGMVAQDTLPLADTWETYISEHGSTRESWNAISPRMGALALLRNIRNFEKVGADVASERVISTFTNAKEIRKSGIFPFQIFNALNYTSNPAIRRSLEAALEASVMNMPALDGKNAIFIDISGSMDSPVFSRAEAERGQLNRPKSYPISCKDIASLMAALLLKRVPEESEFQVGTYGTDFGLVDASRKNSVVENFRKIRKSFRGHGTNAHLTIEYLLNNKIKMDRVFVFSDMQNYGGDFNKLWTRYKKEVNPEAYLYMFDLAGDGHLVLPENSEGVVTIAGWSDKILTYIEKCENQKDVLDMIRAEW